MSENKGKNPFDMSLDEIIALKNDTVPTENDVLDLGVGDDIIMEEDLLDDRELEHSTTKSMMSFGRNKDPELSVNTRLRPENLVARPYGMPPLVSNEAQRQLQELDEMKAENRLHELSDFRGSRSTLNSCNQTMSNRSQFRAPTSSRGSLYNFGRHNTNSTFTRNYHQHAIGSRSLKGGVSNAGRNLRQKLVKTLEECKKNVKPSQNVGAISTLDTKPLTSGNVHAILQDETFMQYVDVINKNFGSKYDMNIQKEIALLQKKPFVYACGKPQTIIQDGPGIEGPKMMAISTKSSVNCRFSQL